MQLQQQVTSLEISKRMKELGAPQESLHYWHDGCSTFTTPHIAGGCIGQTFSAYTVAELGEMLPSHIHLESKGLPQYLFIAKKDDDRWMVGYSDYETEGTPPVLDTEADARGKMLIYLVENKLWNFGQK